MAITARPHKLSISLFILFCLGCGLDGWGSIPGRSKTLFLFIRQSPYPAFVQWITGVFPGGTVKRPDLYADHAPSSSAEIKNGRAIPPLLSIRVRDVVLNQAQGQLHFSVLIELCSAMCR
jgi:hypothetical protein